MLIKEKKNFGIIWKPMEPYQVTHSRSWVYDVEWISQNDAEKIIPILEELAYDIDRDTEIQQEINMLNLLHYLRLVGSNIPPNERNHNTSEEWGLWIRNSFKMLEG